MQDGYRILGSGKSGKMAKIYQHHKFPPCLGFPSMGERTRRILHTFSDITFSSSVCFTTDPFGQVFYKKCPQSLYTDFADREFYASVRFTAEVRRIEMLLCGQHSLRYLLSRHFVEFLQEREHHEGADKTECNQNAPVVHQWDAVPKH